MNREGKWDRKTHCNVQYHRKYDTYGIGNVEKIDDNRKEKYKRLVPSGLPKRSIKNVLFTCVLRILHCM